MEYLQRIVWFKKEDDVKEIKINIDTIEYYNKKTGGFQKVTEINANY